MSILEDFLTNDLKHLPNDTQNITRGTLPPDAPHHKHHHTDRISMHSTMHGQRALQSIEQINKNSAKKTQNAKTASATNCLPNRKKNAADFLSGNTPGVMAFYAPEEQQRMEQHPCPQPANIRANTRPDNATVEDAETVQRLVEWREESAY